MSKRCECCKEPLPPRKLPPDRRKYCNDLCKQKAYLLRKAGVVVPENIGTVHGICGHLWFDDNAVRHVCVWPETKVHDVHVCNCNVREDERDA